MDDFFVARRKGSLRLRFPPRALKSSHFLVSKSDSGFNPMGHARKDEKRAHDDEWIASQSSQ